jgi:hypothetical protein
MQSVFARTRVTREVIDVSFIEVVKSLRPLNAPRRSTPFALVMDTKPIQMVSRAPGIRLTTEL